MEENEPIDDEDKPVTFETLYLLLVASLEHLEKMARKMARSLHQTAIYTQVAAVHRQGLEDKLNDYRSKTRKLLDEHRQLIEDENILPAEEITSEKPLEG